MRRQPVDLWSLLRSVVAHRELILHLAYREVTQRFQGSEKTLLHGPDGVA